ncbi:MAG: Flp pilus assembly protein CpaB [Acidobacteria bacterium]|nr:Flp pilus assembly protein CpaB [Acidobacteriota bacterium]
MDTRRLAIAILTALIISGGATYFFYARLRGREASLPQIIKIVAAAKAQPAGGVVLKAEDLALIDWPSTVPLQGSFSKIDDVVGRSLIYPLGEKEPVLELRLAAAGSGFGLTAKIPTGMRATSVRSNEIVGVAGFLFPGSHVDVLATFRPTGVNEQPVTQTVLQDVEVITAGQKIQPDPQGKPETVNVVTLLLSPDDSEKLLLASTQATIHFVLRSGADREKVETTPVRLDELITGVKRQPEVKETRPRSTTARAVKPSSPKPPDFYTVEIIHGDKRSEATFE